MFCVLAGRRELVLAARLNPGLAAEYAAVEARIGHRFRADLSMTQINSMAQTDAAAAADRGSLPAGIRRIPWSEPPERVAP